DEYDGFWEEGKGKEFDEHIKDIEDTTMPKSHLELYNEVGAFCRKLCSFRRWISSNNNGMNVVEYGRESCKEIEHIKDIEDTTMPKSHLELYNENLKISVKNNDNTKGDEYDGFWEEGKGKEFEKNLRQHGVWDVDSATGNPKILRKDYFTHHPNT
ncbi:130_t:CDS:2, partial [Entrophospora sp. SA101]